VILRAYARIDHVARTGRTGPHAREAAGLCEP